MQWSDRLRNRLASSPVRYGCDCSHPQTHGKLFILQQSQSNFPCHASGGLALLQVRRYMHDLCSYSLTQQAGNSTICAVTLILTIMIVSAAPSVRNITMQYAPSSPPFPPRPCPSPNRRVMLLTSCQTRALVCQIPFILFSLLPSPDTSPHQSHRGDDVAHHSPPQELLLPLRRHPVPCGAQPLRRSAFSQRLRPRIRPAEVPRAVTTTCRVPAKAPPWLTYSARG